MLHLRILIWMLNFSLEILDQYLEFIKFIFEKAYSTAKLVQTGLGVFLTAESRIHFQFKIN